MKIPVFVSAPSSLNDAQRSIYDALMSLLDDLQIERRALGRSDYPTELPLREVLQIARRCSGGIVLGFVQQECKETTLKPGTKDEKVVAISRHPTPWNNLEAGILFALGLPTVIFREEGISGGIFDNGVSDVFIHAMPPSSEFGSKESSFRQVLLKWQAQVRNHYYTS